MQCNQIFGNKEVKKKQLIAFKRESEDCSTMMKNINFPVKVKQKQL